MPGPLGESCGTCYFWDRDDKQKGRSKTKVLYHAECCYGAPGDRAEIIDPREDKWCSEYEEIEFGIGYRSEVPEDEDEEPTDPE